MVGLCGYSWSWSLRCLIDVIRWLIDVDRCLVVNVMLCTKYPYWGIFPLCFEILGHGWVVWLSLILIIEMFDWCYQVIDWHWQMLGWRCHVLYYVPNVHIGAYSPVLDEIVHRWIIIVSCLPLDSNIRYYIEAYYSPWWDFVCPVVRGWMIGVGYLPHDFDIRSYIRAYFLIFFRYPSDWDSGQLGFRSSTSMGLLTFNYIRTPYMDLLR